jgi:hypothetical protein
VLRTAKKKKSGTHRQGSRQRDLNIHQRENTMIASGRLVGLFRLALLILATTALFGCSGGGGGGSGSGGSTATLHLSASSVAFQALAADPADETINVQITWSNPAVAGVLIGTPPGQALPGWLNLTSQGNASPVTMALRRVVNGNAAGQYSATIRVVSGDANLNVIDIVDLPVSFEVVAIPTIAPGSLNLSWVESQQPANQQLTITRDNRVQVVSTGVDLNWLDLATNGNALTLSANAQSQSQTPGPHPGTLTAAFSFNGRQRNVTVPIAATVDRALNGPAQIATQVNASTVLAGLSLSANITAATTAGIQFNASTNVPWLTAGNGMTGSPNNLTLTLLSSALSTMANGIYPGTITLTAPNVTALQIPVSLNLRLPEVHFVAPVAFSDTVANDFVIARGAGFDDPNAAVQIDGVAFAGVVNNVNDTEIRFVPGAGITAGPHEVKVTNGLNFNRDTANLRVAAPPAYPNFSMDAAVGLQERIISSPINAAVFSQMCYFCQLTGTGTPSTVQRFTFNAGTWTHTEHGYTNLFDIALSPDESTLLVLTATQLLLVDPQTMQTTKPPITLPPTALGQSRQLAVMNNGLVIIHALGQAYSLRGDNFVPITGLVSDGGIAASRDGSRAIFGEPSNNHDVAYRYYDASTGKVFISATSQFYARGAYTRHAERAFVSNRVVGDDLASLGTLEITSDTGDIGPDGNRAYGLNTSTNPYRLRVFDVSTLTELAPIDITNVGTGAGIARAAADPSGSFVFVISEGKFAVVAVP